METADRGAWITVRGARTHNLRGVSVRVPKHHITAFTGVSGSGKSSLAFDTVAAEAERLVASSYPAFVRSRLPQHPIPDVDSIDGLTHTVTIDQAPFGGGARSTLGTASDLAPMLRLLFSRIASPSAGYSPAYSFNDPSGMCPRCEGLGTVDDIDLEQLLDPTLSLREGPVRFPTFAPGTYRWKRLVLSGLADPDRPWADLPGHVRDELLHARGHTLTDPQPGYPAHGEFDGIITRLRESYLRRTPSRLTAAEREALARVVRRAECPDCRGARLNEAARASLLDGRSIVDWTAMPVADLLDTVARVGHPGVAPLVAGITERLQALVDVGLGYLSLDRHASTLSGGEAQPVKIVRHLGSALSDTTYVFDEPSAGLHPHDVARLLTLIRGLRDAHNTVLVVEHHPQVIAAADHVVDLGPGAGVDGGTIIFTGTPEALLSADTVTGRSLAAGLGAARTPRTARGSVTVVDATRHNLRRVTVAVPLGVLTVVTGVAGSGKSTLFTEELPAQHPDFTVIGQQALRGGARATPATTLDVAEPIRRAFTAATGLAPSWFSANGKGACPTCRGKGVIVTDLAFLDEVRTPCEACAGSRFGPRTLRARHGGLTIADVLGLRPADVVELFADVPAISGPVRWMHRVGLGYLPIGQGLDTLSGGELQRLALARQLAVARPAGDLQLVIDEPTVGLHLDDVDRLLDLMDELVDQGATLVLVEHHQRVIARADHVIDIGPGAGSDGGTIVHAGTLAELLEHPTSLTGAALRDTRDGPPGSERRKAE